MKTLEPAYPYYLANKAIYANTDLPVTDKYTGHVATSVALAGPEVIEAAITAAVAAESCLLYTSPSPRDATLSRMPSSA